MSFKHLLILSLLCSAIGCYSQTSFVTTYGTSLYEIPVDIEQIGGFYYVCQNVKREPFVVQRVAQITKLDALGAFVKDTIFSEVGDEYCSFQTIIPKTDTSFLVIGSYKYTTEHEMIWVMEMNHNLEVIWQKNISTGNFNVNKISYAINDSGNIVLAMACVVNPYPAIVFSEITFSGDSVRLVAYNHGNPSSVDVQALVYNNGKYYVSVDGFTAYVGPSSSQIITLDTAFNILDYQIGPDFINTFRHAEVLNDSAYLMGGMTLTFDTGFDLTLTKLDYNNQLLDYKHIAQTGDRPDYSARSKCLSISDENSFYLGGTTNDNGMDHVCNVVNKQFILSNLDSLLDCRWTYFYGSDACYILVAVDATDDGGCVMAGIKYDSQMDEQKLDPVIIKVDNTGIITASNDIEMKATNAVVYPNPANDYLIVRSGQQISNALFRLYSSNGKLVRTTILSESNLQINTSDLNAGIYYWQIDRGGVLIENGKWIKF